MPNEVYARTRAGLATLVSPRAATRMLDEALLRSGLSADALAAEAVHDLLLGPVRTELEGILPPGGLRRTLRRLARTVRSETRASRSGRRAPTLFGPGAKSDPKDDPHAGPKSNARSLTPPERYDSQRVRQSSVRLADVPGITDPTGSVHEAPPREGPEPIAPPSSKGEARDDTPSRRAGAGGRRSAPGGRAGPAIPVAEPPRERGHHPTLVPATPGPAWPAPVPKRLSGAELEHVVLGYAALDGVSQVVAVRGRDEVAIVRGTGLDTTTLAPLLRTSVHLLSRHGRLRSLVLEHATGLLFVFPVGTDTIVVLTRPSINIGAVFAARTTLEEAL